MRSQSTSAPPRVPHQAPVPGSPGLAFGEIRTGMLRNGRALGRAETARLLDFMPGVPVRQSERPIAHALSADVANGVDCLLSAERGPQVRAIGTVLSHAVVVGGRALQASTYARVGPAEGTKRLPWSHYTARAGLLEAVGRYDPRDLAAGFLVGEQRPQLLDLGAVAERLVRRTQRSPVLDGVVPLRFEWTRLRWTALYGAAHQGPEPAASFVLRDENLRTLNLWIPAPPGGTVPGATPGALLEPIIELCRDVALHDWVLTTLTRRLERLDALRGDRARSVRELRDIVDHLLPLWMPGARVADGLSAVWTGFERRPGFTRQWDAAVGRVRDQMALNTLRLLEEAAEESARPGASTQGCGGAERK